MKSLKIKLPEEIFRELRLSAIHSGKTYEDLIVGIIRQHYETRKNIKD